MKTLHDNSKITMTIISGDNHIFCSMGPETVATIGDIVIKDPEIVDGMGEKKVYSKCKFCHKDRLSIVAEACELRYSTSKSKEKNIVYLSGEDSYYFQIKLNEFSETRCLCI